MTKENRLTNEELESLIVDLKKRFARNMVRHKDIEWHEVEDRLKKYPAKAWSLREMDQTGGEPDVAGQDPDTGEFIFYDFSKQSPKGRTSLCYDREALEARKKYKPKDSAMNMAENMGINLLTEEEYFHLQSLGEFDTTTSSWLLTPAEIREKGGAIFGDRRFGRVFIYHNGADSYFGVRGFRGSLRI